MKRHILTLAALLAAAHGAQAQAPAAAPVPVPAADGKALFAKNCAACHQASGKGIPGAFPALAGNGFVQGAPDDVATVLLKGRGGMPDFSGSLDDAEIAQVLSYVRSSWGNSAAPLGEQEVGARRLALGVGPATRSRFGNKH
ncbi:cytochrome c [Herbaspirillum sp. SJZ107]|uniref:c-type cytochrome n=1 Tax=Herbaspirillum sp. SJZ107 TaxID=2572881 RepID=UPI0011540EB1|nr:cytochrome c [Herbaspirillum sp. SJZ107]TQK08061.1 mono/diheme cytochrome c family protein [Herbaspirillum sp. SJZ107]